MVLEELPQLGAAAVDLVAAEEIEADPVRERFRGDVDGQLFYLCRTYLPLPLDKDPTFGLKLPDLGRALAARAEICEDTITRNACISPKLRVVWVPRPLLAWAFAPGLAAVPDYLRRVSGMAAPMSSKAWRCSRVGVVRTGTAAGVPAKHRSLRVRVPRWASSPRKLR